MVTFLPIMKFFSPKLICLSIVTLLSFGNNRSIYKYNSCDFKKNEKKIELRYGVSIITYCIVNDSNKDNLRLSEYYLIKSENDTFNVINTFYGSTSDSTVKKFRYSTNWLFLPLKDTACFDFFSYFNLKDIIDCKYPVLFGRIAQGLD